MARITNQSVTLAAGASRYVDFDGDWLALTASTDTITVQFDQEAPVDIWALCVYEQKYASLKFNNPTAASVTFRFQAGVGPKPYFPPVAASVSLATRATTLITLAPVAVTQNTPIIVVAANALNYRVMLQTDASGNTVAGDANVLPPGGGTQRGVNIPTVAAAGNPPLIFYTQSDVYANTSGATVHVYPTIERYTA